MNGIPTLPLDKYTGPPPPNTSNRRVKLRKYEALERAGRRCEDCGVGADLTIHHRVPFSEGGDDSIENLTVLCAPCHMDLHGMAPR